MGLTPIHLGAEIADERGARAGSTPVTGSSPAVALGPLEVDRDRRTTVG